MRGVEGEVVDKFEALSKSAQRHKAAFERDLAAMYKLLPEMRKAGNGPTVIEKMSGHLIPRDTASRLTAPVIGTSRTRKPADA